MAIYGFYKFKYIFINKLNKKHYTYSPDIVYVGDIYIK